MRLFPHSDQEGTQALEGTHSGVKGGVIRPAKRVIVRRCDWLCHTLLDDVIPDYERRAVLRAAGFDSKPQQARAIAATIAKARLVPDSHLAVLGTSRVSVRSLSDATLLHEVLQPGTAWSTCSCLAGARGQVCYHQVRAAMAVQGDTPATLQLFSAGHVGIAVRRPALCTAQEQGAGQAVRPQYDPLQLKQDFEVLLRSSMASGASARLQAPSSSQQPGAVAAQPAAGAPAAAAAAAVGTAASSATARTVATSEAGPGVQQHEDWAEHNEPSQGYVASQGGVISDVRLKPILEQAAQRHRRRQSGSSGSNVAAATRLAAPQCLVRTKQPTKKPQQSTEQLLRMAAQKAAVAAAPAPAAAPASAITAPMRLSSTVKPAVQPIHLQQLQQQLVLQQWACQQALQQPSSLLQPQQSAAHAALPVAHVNQQSGQHNVSTAAGIPLQQLLMQHAVLARLHQQQQQQQAAAHAHLRQALQQQLQQQQQLLQQQQQD